MIRRVLLWDVDGTLVKTGGLGAAVFDVALERVLGVRPHVRVRMSGKTDPQIVREYLSQMGIEETPDLIEAVLGHIERSWPLSPPKAASPLRAGPVRVLPQFWPSGNL